MKIRCLIVEDEPKAMSLLQEYVEQVAFLELVHSASDAVDALNYANRNEVDLVFLDINLPDLSGLELAGLMKERIKIIFTTAYSQYAVQSYEQNAVDYLLKPITFSRFLLAVQKAKAVLETAKKGTEGRDKTFADAFLVKSGKKILQLHWSSIYYLEGMKEYVTLVSSTAKTIVYKRMKAFEALHPPGFVRVHNSYILNTNFIQKIEDNHVYVLDKAIPIGKKYREQFLKQLHNRFI